MKIVFLDFDGVLNTSGSVYLRTINFKQHPIESIACPNPVCVQLFDWMLELEPDLKIVVSSSWRKSRTVDELKLVLKDEFKLTHYDRVIGKTRSTYATVDGIDDLRGHEIEDYIKQNAAVISHYCIIDDDSDMLDHHRTNFVQTHYDHGFMLPELLEACQILEINEGKKRHR